MTSYLASVLRRHHEGSVSLRPRWLPFADSGEEDEHDGAVPVSTTMMPQAPYDASENTIGSRGTAMATKDGVPETTMSEKPVDVPHYGHEPSEDGTTEGGAVERLVGLGSTHPLRQHEPTMERSEAPLHAVPPAVLERTMVTMKAISNRVHRADHRASPNNDDVARYAYRNVDVSLPTGDAPVTIPTENDRASASAAMTQGGANRGDRHPTDNVVNLHIGRIDIRVNPVTIPNHQTGLGSVERERPSLEDFMQRRRETLP